MERARDGHLRGLHRARLGGEPLHLFQRVGVAGNHAAGGEQVVGDGEHDRLGFGSGWNRRGASVGGCFPRGGDARLEFVVGEADHGEHAVVALLGGGLHGLRAALYHAQAVLERHRAREHQSGVLAEAQTGGARAGSHRVRRLGS